MTLLLLQTMWTKLKNFCRYWTETVYAGEDAMLNESDERIIFLQMQNDYGLINRAEQNEEPAAEEFEQNRVINRRHFEDEEDMADAAGESPEEAGIVKETSEPPLLHPMSI